MWCQSACAARSSAWPDRSGHTPAYRCRHGHTSAARPDPRRPKNAYLREAQILPHLAALAILLGDAQQVPYGTTQITAPGHAAGLIDQLRTAGITLTYDPDTRTIRTGDSDTLAVTIGQDR
jgi:site-specific DNA recombinase